MNLVTRTILEALIESLKVDSSIEHDQMVSVLVEIQDLLNRRLK